MLACVLLSVKSGLLADVCPDEYAKEDVCPNNCDATASCTTRGSKSICEAGAWVRPKVNKFKCVYLKDNGTECVALKDKEGFAVLADCCVVVTCMWDENDPTPKCVDTVAIVNPAPLYKSLLCPP